jgi:hypothetical protein
MHIEGKQRTYMDNPVRDRDVAPEDLPGIAPTFVAAPCRVCSKTAEPPRWS